MKKKEIIVRIPPDGKQVTIDQEGMVGKECSENVKNLIDKLGTVSESHKKSDFYKKKDVHIHIDQ